MVLALTRILNALPQAELQARQSGEYLAGQIGIVQTGRLLLIHQVSQQWKAHQRLLLPTEASTNNTPLIALENLSSLIMLCAEAVHADKTARTRGFSCDCHPVSSPFHQTCILPYIIVLFTIMHPMADPGFWCTVLQSSHTNEGAASLTHLSLLVGRLQKSPDLQGLHVLQRKCGYSGNRGRTGGEVGGCVGCGGGGVQTDS